VTAASNLLAFFALALTLLLVWRRSWPGRLRLFVLQSVLLALLAATVGWLAGKPALVVVAGVFLVLKGWIIPRVLRRMAAGTPVRPGAPGQSSGVTLLAAGGLVVAAYTIILPVTVSATLPSSGCSCA
jgi:hydrogenase-4 membrane subunit HyfE